MDIDGTFADIVEAQLQNTGASCVRVEDGHVFTFTSELLERMLERAKEAGRVVVFVKTGMMS